MADSTTTTYSFTLPEVGASADSWGTKLNANWSKVDDLFDGTVAVTGINLTTFKVDSVIVTASAAELNKLDGVTASTAELNYLDGVTSNIQTQLDAKQDSGGEVSFGDLTGTPTTLSGYGITDAATSAQGSLADTAVQPSDAASLTSITLGTWTISDSAGKLIFSNGSTRFSISAAGAIIAGDDITAFGTP